MKNEIELIANTSKKRGRPAIERILQIREVQSYDPDTRTVKESNTYYAYDGYEIETNHQKIFIGIDNYQACCENWGYFMSEDDISYYKNAKLLSIKITDTALNKEKYEANEGYEGDVMFVDVETDVGVLQFVAYNWHNGYYGHSAVVRSKQLTYDVGL